MDVTQTLTAHDLKHESQLISCRFDPSGKFVFAGAEDFAVWRWNVESGEKIKLFTDSWVLGIRQHSLIQFRGNLDLHSLEQSVN